ncbi:MAG TPA: ATP-binding protein [Chthoniobacterales bacterium]
MITLDPLPRSTPDGLHHSPDESLIDKDFAGSATISREGTILACNAEFARIFGFQSAEDAVNTNFLSLLRTRRDAADLLSLVSERRTIDQQELEMRQRNGEPVYVVARLVGSFNQSGELMQLHATVFNDTKRKRLEEQVIQSQKMEGLGTLAGGIAHDFNNILAIILGYTSQIEKRAMQPEFMPIATKAIKDAVERGAALVQQLLTSARQTEAQLAPIDLNELVRELERMLRATFPKTIDFELQLEPDLPLVKADRSQIHQVLLNLSVNARDAMPNGGRLTIETSVRAGEEVHELFTGASAKHYARIRVTDNGSGMSAEVKAHIFDPFFTTKERAKGTGLGLSVVYGVVNNHRGFVHVETEPNIGTTFSIYLPLHAIREGSAGADAGVSASKIWEPQTILLVEDEEMLRELGTQVLQSEGYRVLTASDGVEAVETFRTNRDDIGLVVCDLGLPRLNGRDVFMKLREIKPSVRAIVVSGYLEPSQRSEILKAGVIDTVQKPYDFGDLLERIRSVIGKAQSEDDHPQLF